MISRLRQQEDDGDLTDILWRDTLQGLAAPQLLIPQRSQHQQEKN